VAAEPARNFCGDLSAQLVSTGMRLFGVEYVTAKMGLFLALTTKLVAPPTAPSALQTKN
jgi:hypothetical protein